MITSNRDSCWNRCVSRRLPAYVEKIICMILRFFTTRRWLTALGVLCLLCLSATLWISAHNHDIGEPDCAAYADQADALLAGHGFQVGYIQHYYTRFADIRHPEDHYAPGNGVLLAGAFRLFGRSEFSAAIPSALIACLLLPLLAFILARALSASPPFAFGCAVTVMFTFLLRKHAFYALADLPFTACALAAFIFALRGTGRSLLAAGVMVAATYYLKSTGLILLPIISLVYFLSAVKPDRRVWARLGGMWLLCLLFISPWLARNAHLFGNPFFSANQYVAGGIDFDRHFWATQRWKVWWDTPHAAMPSLSHVVKVYGMKRVAIVIVKRLWLAVRIQHVYYLLLLVSLMFLRKRRDVVVLTAGIICYPIILCLLFGIESRYLLPIIPLMLAIGWLAYERVICGALPFFSQRQVWPQQMPLFVPAVAVVVLAFICSAPEVERLGLQLTDHLPAIPTPRADEQEVKIAAEWANDHLAVDARCMSQSAWQFRYYSQRLVVNQPIDTPAHIDAVVTHYHIDYLLLCDDYYNSDLRASAHGVPGAMLDYLQHYSADWQRVHPHGQPFVLYIRRDAQWPSGVPVPENTMLAYHFGIRSEYEKCIQRREAEIYTGHLW